MIRDIERLFFGDVFDIFNSNAYVNAAHLAAPKLSQWAENDRYVIRAVTPGYAEDELHVAIEGRTINVSGKQEMTDKRNLHRSQVSSFEQSVTLPSDAVMDSVNAEYKNGILAISIDRKSVPALERKSVPIKALGPAT